MKTSQVVFLLAIFTLLAAQNIAAIDTRVDQEAEFEHDDEPGVPAENTAEKQEECPFNEKLNFPKESYEEYIRFARQYNKAYLCNEEDGNFYFRLGVFLKTQEFNEGFRKEFPDASFTVGITFFADLTEEERLRRAGIPEKDLDNPKQETIQLLPDNGFDDEEAITQQDRNQEEFTANIQNAEIFQKFLINWNFICCLWNPFGVPCSKDWQALGKVTSVKNQQNCGSCWAFAAIASLESAYAIKYGWALNLSEQELVSCATSSWGNYGCSGGWPHKALDYIISKRIFQEVNFPYTATNSACISPTVYKYPAKSRTIVLPQNRMDVFLKALNQRPIAVAFKVTNAFYSYTGGVYNAALDANCLTPGINHAVLAVGYNLGCTPFIRFKNSWGSGWGESGYFRFRISKTIVQNGPCNLINHPYNVYPSI